jgi:hypothetical protein
VYVWLLAAVRLGIALDIAVASGPNLVNNATQGRIIMNGIWYSRSNSTTDVNAMDPLLDAEACTRDAALMSELGINTIYVMAIDAKENHDDCFSIFNSVGIYVMLVLRKDGIFSTTASDFVKSYNTDFLKDMFEMIDAVKDYDNMLGFDLGVFPHMGEFALGTVDVSYVDAEKMYRVRHTRIIATGRNLVLTMSIVFHQGYKRIHLPQCTTLNISRRYPLPYPQR